MTVPAVEQVITPADIDQIIEGIEQFIIDGHAEVDAIWQPYIDKLKALRALVVQRKDDSR